MDLASTVASHPFITAAAVGGVAAYIYRELFCVDKPRLYFKDNERNERLVSQLTELHRGYKYPLWGNVPHAQTLYASGMRWAPREEYCREEVTSHDGGVVILDWFETQELLEARAEAHSKRVTVVIVPGICSHSESCYIRHFARMCNSHGLRSVVYTPRGCVGEVKTPRMFTFGDTEDLRTALAHIKDCSTPEEQFVAVGFSLGANLVCKYLGEIGSTGEPGFFRCGVSISQGYNGALGIAHLQKAPFYEKGLVNRLKKLVRRNSHMFADHVDVDYILNQVTDIAEFDRHFTCRLWGFPDPETYYARHSCVNYLEHVREPLLLLNALDDPLVTHEAIPFDLTQHNSNIILATTEYGGHLGWCEGVVIPSLTHWHERVCLEYIDTILGLQAKQ